VIALEAARCGAPYVNQRWLGGMLNQLEHRFAPRIDRLKDLERMESSGGQAPLRPQERSRCGLRRELAPFCPGSIWAVLKEHAPPARCGVLVDSAANPTRVWNARKLAYPCVDAVTQTAIPDLPPTLRIPCNDDAVRSVSARARFASRRDQ